MASATNWRSRGLTAVVLAAAASGLALSPAAADDASDLRAFGVAVQRDDCAAVLKRGEPLLAPGRRLPAELESPVYETVVGCAYRRGSKQKAEDYAIRGSRLESASDDLWRLRLGLELDEKQLDAAVATVEEMSQGRGAALNKIPITWLRQLGDQLREGQRTEERKRLLKILSADAYAPEESVGDAQGVHYDYAVLLAEEGDAAGARAMVRTLTDPGLLAEMMFDPRFRGILPADLDLRSVAETQLTREKEAAARHPDRLDPLINAAIDLRRLGRPQESLTLLQSVSGQIEDKTAFKDRDDKLPWYWDALARTYVALGRYEEAVAAFRKGIAVGEREGLNVSQTINLAHAQVQFGHGEDALQTLSGFDDPKRQASPYGLMEMHLARGCAQAAAAHPGAAAADLAFARAHEKDHPEALADLYLCLGNMDEAAAAFIRRLQDPDRRAQALKQLSDYEERPSSMPAPLFERQYKALKARPDVRAAIEQAGGLRRIPLQPDDL
jgi:tetratricopeptide (TPR) repeat protein